MKNKTLILAALSLCLPLLSACSEARLAAHVAKQIGGGGKSKGAYKVGNPYKVAGRWYTPKEDFKLVETGIASWYGPQFHLKKTANGEIFNMNELTAAHRTLQLPSIVRVTNLENGRALIVRVNDRGPFKRGRVIDLSRKSAELLGFKNQGTAKVKLEVLEEESRAVALAAQQGRDTSGVEVAMNERLSQPVIRDLQTRQDQRKPLVLHDAKPVRLTRAQTGADNERSSAPVPAPLEARDMVAGTQANAPASGFTPVSASVKREVLPPPSAIHSASAANPARLVQQVPVPKANNLFVQAGAFSVEGNARAFAEQLKAFGAADVYPAQVNGRTFYRVRISAPNVAQADMILARLVNSGNAQAVIVVD